MFLNQLVAYYDIKACLARGHEFEPNYKFISLNLLSLGASSKEVSYKVGVWDNAQISL